MLSKKQQKVVKGSKPAKNSKKPPPPNTDSERSDSEGEKEASASASAVAGAASETAFNPFAILDAAEDDAWEEVGPKKKKGKDPAPPPPPPAPAPPPSRTRTSTGTILAPQASTSRPAPLRSTFGAPTPGAASTSGRPPLGAPDANAPAPTPRAAPAPEPRPSRRTHGADGRPLTNDYYRAFQKLTKESSGDVVLRFHKTDIVRFKANGDVFLSCGGYFTRTTQMSMNDSLRYIGMRVKGNGADWTVEDPYGKYSYDDNMTVKAGSAADRGRAAAVYKAYYSTDGEGQEEPAARTAGRQEGRALSGAQAESSQQQQPAPVTAAAPGGPPLAPAPPTSGSPSLAYRLAYSNYQTQYESWQQQQAAKQQQDDAATAAAAAEAAAAPVRWDPSVHPKDALLSAQDYDQWAGGFGYGATAAATVGAQGGAAAEGDSGSDNGGDEKWCVVCMEAERDTVLVPCGHCVLCERCCNNIMAGSSKECPLCRQPVSMHVAI